MTIHIEENYELYEVLNAFPILKISLERLDFKVSEIMEGISIKDYFTKKHFSEEEIDLIVRKFNNDVKLHFRQSEKKESIEIL